MPIQRQSATQSANAGGDKINPGDTPPEVPAQQPEEVPPGQTD